MPTLTSLFSKDSWSVNNYRIPSLIKTDKGTLIACCDARYFGAADFPNRIDKIVRRSTDNGQTWSDVILAVAEEGEKRNFSGSSIDPSLVQDNDTGRIFMLFTHTPHGIGILNAKRGLGVNKQGERYVFKGKEKFVAHKGFLVTENGDKTGFAIDPKGNITNNGTYVCNISKGDGAYNELPTYYLTISYSDDDGITWSEPKCIDHMVKDKKMAFICAGPGVGIQLKNGKYKGRIVYPMYYSKGKTPIISECCAIIYSDDHGETWNIGISPNMTRKRILKSIFKDYILMPGDRVSESQAIELDDGTVRLFMRNHNSKKEIAVADSVDGGHTFSNFRFIGINQPICQISVIRFEDKKIKYTAILNSDSKTNRENGTIRLSVNDGDTFEWSRLLAPGGFVYSTMAYLGDGKIGVLYENSTEHNEIVFTVVDIDWIKGDK